MSLPPLLAAAGLTACCLLAMPGAARAETYHTCKGFIDTLPATITTQGVWCLRNDLATAITSGQAIIIATSNVTIDCNGYKLGGLSAGIGTATVGIYAFDRLNATVRNCNVRGFLMGISLGGDGGGHLIEDNRLDANTYLGAYVRGDGSVVRRNSVFDSGGTSLNFGVAIGLYADGAVQVDDNVVSGVAAAPAATAYGIYTVQNFGGTVAGNRIRGLVSGGGSRAVGVYVSLAADMTVKDNVMVGDGDPDSVGIFCDTSMGAYAKDNVVLSFNSPVAFCADLGNSP